MSRPLLGAICACLLALGAGPARGQDMSKAVLLVASPTLQGLYSQTLLMAAPVGDKHVGFILNRATEVKLAALYPHHAPSAKVADPIYFGGPEMADALFAVARRDPGGQSMALFGELFVTASAESIDRIIEQAPNDARYFAGFVGWQPGELEDEIKRGYWYATDPDPGLFFRSDTSGLWEELVKRLGNGHAPQQGRGLRSAMSTERPGHANETPWVESGSARSGLPSSARIAFASAGAITGVAGSPTPEGFSCEATMWVSIGGIWLMRSTG